MANHYEKVPLGSTVSSKRKVIDANKDKYILAEVETRGRGTYWPSILRYDIINKPHSFCLENPMTGCVSSHKVKGLLGLLVPVP